MLTSNSTVIRTNTGKDIALFKEVDGVPMIDAKNINTENLVVTSGAILGGWEIKDNNIVSRDIADAKILLEVSGTRFCVLMSMEEFLLKGHILFCLYVMIIRTALT